MCGSEFSGSSICYVIRGICHTFNMKYASHTHVICTYVIYKIEWNERINLTDSAHSFGQRWKRRRKAVDLLFHHFFLSPDFCSYLFAAESAVVAARPNASVEFRVVHGALSVLQCSSPLYADRIIRCHSSNIVHFSKPRMLGEPRAPEYQQNKKRICRPNSAATFFLSRLLSFGVCV